MPNVHSIRQGSTYEEMLFGVVLLPSVLRCRFVAQCFSVLLLFCGIQRCSVAMTRDIVFAWRTIVRMPALAVVVILSLGVGIGVNTVVFSWMQSVLFRPIAGVRHAGDFHLVEPRTDSGIYPAASWLEYRDLAERLRTMEALIAFRMVPLYVGE